MRCSAAALWLGVAGCAFALVLVPGCRDLIQPTAPLPDIEVRITDDEGLPIARARIVFQNFRFIEDPLLAPVAKSVTVDEEGVGTVQIPAGVYDIEVDISGERWILHGIEIECCRVVVSQSMLATVSGQVVVPVGAQVFLDDANAVFRYRLDGASFESRTTVQDDGSFRLRLSTAAAGRLSVTSSASSYSWDDITLDIGATQELNVPLVPVALNLTVGGSIPPPGELVVSLSDGAGTVNRDVEVPASAAQVWGFEGVNSLVIQARTRDYPILTQESFVELPVSAPLPVELGRHRVDIQVRTQDGIGLPGINVTVHSGANISGTGFASSADGTLFVFLEPGTFILRTDTTVSTLLPASMVIEVDSDVAVNLTLPPAP